MKIGCEVLVIVMMYRPRSASRTQTNAKFLITLLVLGDFSARFFLLESAYR